MSEFIQDAPRASNRFRTDRSLRLTLERLLPPEIMAEASAALDRMGERAAYEMPGLADRAEANPPRHTIHDAWGRRIDRIDIDPAWQRLVEIGQEEGLVALPYEAPYREYSRVVQAGLANLFDPVSATAACPLVMSDGAAWLLRRHDPELAERYLPRLTARRGGWTSGQWMTEKEGGSDVSRTSTVALEDGAGGYALTGTKWFTSATSADIALALARVGEGEGDGGGGEPGGRGLSLFLVELRRPDGSWNGIRVRRMKDKMGTKGLPTAELDLIGTKAVPVGGLGRGVAKIASLLNIARVSSALSGPAAVGHLLSLARDYASSRMVLGGRLAALPMHTAWLAHIAAEYEAMLALGFETAAALGRAEAGGNSSLARLLPPLAKLALARQGIWGASELLESFGGAGYLEDTGIPRVLRNVHVNAIWEGTTSVLSHDVLRALGSPAIGQEWIEDIERRLAGLNHPALEPIQPRVAAALETLRPMVVAPDESQGRRLAQGMARTTQAALLAEAAQWRLQQYDDPRALVAAEIVTRHAMVAPPMHDMDLAALAYGFDPRSVEAMKAA